MNLTSCDSCGVVLDTQKMDFPVEIYDEDGAVITENAEWNGNGFSPKTKCPVCNGSILKNT